MQNTTDYTDCIDYIEKKMADIVLFPKQSLKVLHTQETKTSYLILMATHMKSQDLR